MKEKYKYHFVLDKGWCNDPNGLIYVDGQYHLFYQHNPDDTIWGPMHWGHAISTDLLDWQFESIAIYPDDDEYIFSGSCIYDIELAKDGMGPLFAFYTGHNPISGEEQQCLAYSNDNIHFEKYPGNPIIKNLIDNLSNEYMKDFRDPKIFKNPYKGGYSLVIAAGTVVKFYHSNDLINWNYTGEFDPGEKGFKGICECPDCFISSIDGEDYWILSLSMIIDDSQLGNDLLKGEYPYNHLMQYFVGKFDGNNFSRLENIDDRRAAIVNKMFGADIAEKCPLILDYGLDNYGMVTFSGLSANNILMMGWGECWEYVNRTEAHCINEKDLSRGKMTLPRRAKLVNTPKGMRLSFDVAANLPCESFEVVDGQSITLYASNNKPLVITLSDNKIWVLRKASDVTDRHNSFCAERFYEGSCKFKVYRDEDYFEIFAEDGLCPFTVMVY